MQLNQLQLICMMHPSKYQRLSEKNMSLKHHPLVMLEAGQGPILFLAGIYLAVKVQI